MSYTINAFSHKEWELAGLADYADFSDCITECNMGEDAFSGYGEWYYIPDEPLPTGERVIYFGSWGNDNSPGASMYTSAELFDGTDPDDMVEFCRRAGELQSQPEYLDVDDGENER